MSIEMDNPKTPLELVDAARNHVAQIRLALAVGDRRSMEENINKAEDRLFKLQTEIEKTENACAHKWVTKRAGGSPSDADSDEGVCYCDICGDEYDEETHGPKAS